MKIVFICGSLEPGRDGVGDYTRRLAGELIRQGQDVRILALNDKAAKFEKPEIRSQKAEPTPDLRPPTAENVSAFNFPLSAFIQFQESEGTRVECLRLPMTSSWPERVRWAREWVKSFQPDWVSLQFVPFGFQPKGLCFGLGQRLKTIAPHARWHIMFHELWIGLGEKSSMKHRLWGALQRHIVMDLVKRLQPRAVHTQAEPYRVVLQNNGVAAEILPLFGNVPFVAGDGWGDILRPALMQAIGQVPVREEFYLAGVFGAVHPEWDPEVAVNTVLPLVQRFHKKLALIFFGRNGLTAMDMDRLKAQFKDRAEIVMLGEKPTADISKTLQTLDLGITTNPVQLIQKSGTFSAMREHGLPVLILRDDWRLCSGDCHIEVISPGVKIIGQQFDPVKDLPKKDLQQFSNMNLNHIATGMLKELKHESA